MHEPPHVAVSGEAQVQVPPDLVEISLGIEAYDARVVPAQKAADAAAAKLLALGESFGIAKADMQTDYLGLDMERDWSSDRREYVKGYHARKTLSVTLRDLAKFEAYIAAAVAGGANAIHGIEFKTSELRKHRDKARELALKAAHEKAVALATTAGMRVGKPLSIREEGSRWSYPRYSWWGRGGGQMTQNVVQASSAPAPEAGESTAAGRVSITATIGVTYELLAP